MATSERPVPPPLPDASQVPEELRGLRRWVGWRAVYDETKNKWRKPPHSPVTGEGIGAVDKWAEHWLTFDEARDGCIKNGLDGVGFVFKDGDGYVGIDFDDCRLNDQNHTVVDSWLKWLPTYAEVSPSGTGVHAIGKAKIPRSLTATILPNADDAKVEIYNQGRYFTFTGKRIGKISTIGDFQTGVDKLLSYLGDKEIGQPGTEQQRPMSKLTARRIYNDNLTALRNAIMGRGNAELNNAAFFAGRAFAAGALEKTEEQIKDELFNIVTKEWESPHDHHGAQGTIASGWATGIENPLKIMEDDYPELIELMEEFNKEFYVVENLGNKCRVCWETQSPHIPGKAIVLGNQSFNDFRNRFIHEKIIVGTKSSGEASEPLLKSKGEAWLDNRHRTQYEQIVFLPNIITASKVRNLWRGFAYDPKKGNCQRYLEHVFENVCQGLQPKYDYITKWQAYGVRNPGEPGHVALVIQGKKGVGKNVFAEGYSTLWGSHAIVISNEHGVTTNFNAHLRDKCVLVADEAFFAGDPRQDRTLKGMITGRDIAIEAKGIDQITVPNLLHFIIIGNDERLVNATDDERRYFAVRCGDKHKDDHAYFRRINTELQTGGYAALLYHLLYEVDLTGFNVRNAPHTAELISQMQESLRGFEAAWFYCLLTAQMPGRGQQDGTVTIRIVEFVEWCSHPRNAAQRWGRITPMSVGLTLRSNPRGDRQSFNFEKRQQSFNGNNDRVQIITIPTLKECRELWDKLRFKVDWPGQNEKWDTIDLEQ